MRTLLTFLCGISLFMSVSDLSAARMKAPPPATILTGPPAGSVIEGPVTFTWIPGPGRPISSQFVLRIGSSPGGAEYYYSPTLILGTSATVDLDLPMDGSAVYVQVCAVEYIRKPHPHQEYICSNTVVYFTPAPTPTPTPTPGSI